MPQHRDYNTDDPNGGSQARIVKPPAVRTPNFKKVVPPTATGGNNGETLTKTNNPNGGSFLGGGYNKGPIPTEPPPVGVPTYKRLKFQNPPDGPVLAVDPPAFTPADIAKNDPATVQRFSDMLWRVYNKLPAEQREHPFWKGVRANPQGAAASLVARMQTNLMPRGGERLPKLDEAMRARMQQNGVYQLLNFVDYADRNF